jgi:hypothetical protein
MRPGLSSSRSELPDASRDLLRDVGRLPVGAGKVKPDGLMKNPEKVVSTMGVHFMVLK